MMKIKILCAMMLLGLILPAAGLAAEGDKYVRLTTSMGEIVLELNQQAAPATVDNFVKYVSSGHYNGTVFHRVISNFMIQGGGMDSSLKPRKTNASIKNEANNGLKNDKDTVAMARTNDPHSATSQFFINTKDNDFLNFTAENSQGWGYAVFGKVVEGQEVVDKISKVKTGQMAGHSDVPVKPVLIEKAEMVDGYEKK